MRASWCRQESSWVTVPSIDDELESPVKKFLVVLQSFTENLPDGVHFREATAIKTWKHFKLQWYGIMYAFATTYKPAVVEVPSMHTSGSLLGAQV